MLVLGKLVRSLATTTCLVFTFHQSLAVTYPWNNPGGMWRPQDMEKQSELLKNLGFQMSAEDLANPQGPILQSIVSLQYCSGSFISETGLIITNHHCVAKMLSYMSNAQKAQDPLSDADYAETGFYAKHLNQERFVGPTERVLVTLNQEDVSDEVLAGLENVADPISKSKLIDERITQIVKKYESPEKNIKATVKSFYRNRNFILITQLELKNIKLVYAPPKNIGNYGGDTDNWRYPRHVADFALIRAYDEKDQPYRPAHILPIAKDKNSWVQPESPIMVAGYPGRTNRLITHHELEDQVKRQLPKAIEKFEELRNILDELSALNPDYKTKVESTIKSLNNTIKNYKDKIKTINGINFLQIKWDAEHAMTQKYPHMVETIAQLNAAHDGLKGINMDLVYGSSASLVHMIASAVDIVRMASQRLLPDDQRHPMYQERNWKPWMEKENSTQKQWDPVIAGRLLTWTLKRMIALKDKDIPSSIHQLMDVQKARIDATIIAKVVSKLVENSEMNDVKFRIDAFYNATTEQLKELKNPVIDLAFTLIPEVEEFENLEHKNRGTLLEVGKKFIDGLEEYSLNELQRPLASDANSTLRLTFGHVRGSIGPVSKTVYPPFTSVQDLVTKNKWGNDEFEVNSDILRLAHTRNFGRFTDPFYGQIPVNFLAVVDTTGGNSGSAAMNAKGELIGLLFDGMDETLYSDYYFNGSEVRSILVDIRYILSVLETKAKATRILEELHL